MRTRAQHGSGAVVGLAVLFPLNCPWKILRAFPMGMFIADYNINLHHRRSKDWYYICMGLNTYQHLILLSPHSFEAFSTGITVLLCIA